MAIARDTECPLCGLVYDDMRTGLTYSCIYSMLWSASPNPRDWRYKRRHTILGLWHSIKAGQWHEHVRDCEEMKDDTEEAWAEREAIIAVELFPDLASTPVDGVPF